MQPSKTSLRLQQWKCRQLDGGVCQNGAHPCTTDDRRLIDRDEVNPGERSRMSQIAPEPQAANVLVLIAALASMAVLPLLTQCVLTQDRLDASLEVPQRYRAAQGRDDVARPPLEWWRSFHSQELTDFMEQALAANFDIAAAVA